MWKDYQRITNKIAYNMTIKNCIVIIMTNIFHTIVKYESPWKKLYQMSTSLTRISKPWQKLKCVRQVVYQNNYTKKDIKRNPLMKVKALVINQEIGI